jgi:hypothetical protein
MNNVMRLSGKKLTVWVSLLGRIFNIFMLSEYGKQYVYLVCYYSNKNFGWVVKYYSFKTRSP